MIISIFPGHNHVPDSKLFFISLLSSLTVCCCLVIFSPQEIEELKENSKTLSLLAVSLLKVILVRLTQAFLPPPFLFSPHFWFHQNQIVRDCYYRTFSFSWENQILNVYAKWKSESFEMFLEVIKAEFRWAIMCKVLYSLQSTLLYFISFYHFTIKPFRGAG